MSLADLPRGRAVRRFVDCSLIRRIAPRFPVLKPKRHQHIRLQRPHPHRVDPIEPKTLTPVSASMRIVMLAALEKHTRLQVWQTPFAALGKERQPIPNRFANDTDAISARFFDKRGSRNGSRKR